MCRIRRAVIRPPRPGHLADRKRRDAAASLCMRALPCQSSRLLLQRALLTTNRNAELTARFNGNPRVAESLFWGTSMFMNWLIKGNQIAF